MSSISVLVFSSFGLPCVFMIGGSTKAQEPESIYLRDGDVIIMSGKSRMSYHAVPKILPLDFFTQKLNGKLQKAVVTCGVKRPGEFYKTEETKRKKSGAEQACSSKLNAKLFSDLEDPLFWEPFDAYITNNRINLNVRQMFHHGKNADCYDWPETDMWTPCSDG